LVSDVVFSIWASHLDSIWYGVGLVIGAFIGWTIGYFRLRWVERNLERHIFCEAHLLEHGRGNRPSDIVFSRGEES